MAPKTKRRATSATKAGGKKIKEEPETSKPKDAFTSAKEALMAAGPQVKGKRKIDENCELSVRGEVRDSPLFPYCISIQNNRIVSQFYRQ